MIKKLLCLIGIHDYIRHTATVVDEYGSEDGMKVVTCYRCKKPYHKKWNMDIWNRCLYIKGTDTYNERNYHTTDGINACKTRKEDLT